MTATAYLVVFIDTRPRPSGVVRGAGIFGEPTPTTNLRMRTIVLDEFIGENYSEARRLAEDALRGSFYDWCGPLIDDPIRGTLRHAPTDER